jgi:hypothetical protein
MLLQQAHRALLAAFVLGGFAGLLQLVLALCALNVVASAIPAASLETLTLLALTAGVAVLTRACVVAARDRILLRAGLWLEHTLGAHLLEDGARRGTPTAELHKDARALALFAAALTERAAIPLLEAPWVLLFPGVLTLLHPLMGAVAALSAAMLVGVALAQPGRLGGLFLQRHQASEDAATWWLAAGLAPGLPDGAASEWALIDRARIAGAYALGKRAAMLRDLSGLAGMGAQVALVAVGAWLVMVHELTLAALFAAVLVNTAMLGPLGRLLAALPAVAAAMSAHRRLRQLVADAGSRRSTREGPAAASLNVRGPLALGLSAMLVFIVVGLGAAFARLGDLAEVAGGAIFETRLTAVQFAEGRGGARVLVAKGAEVRAGDVIVALDTSPIDGQIAALKAQAETATQQLAQVKQEAAAAVAASELMATDRPSLAALEQRTGELEQEAQWLLARIASAEGELARSEIRAPVSGRVMGSSVRGPDAPVAPGLIEIEIASNDRPLLERLLAPLISRAELRSAPVAQLPAPRS